MRIHDVSAQALAALILSVTFAACEAPVEEQTANEDIQEPASLDQELTSNTALARTLEFGGVVYVASGASDDTILSTVRRQTQSAFGALREADVAVNSRELKDVNPKSFVKTTVSVREAGAPTATARSMIRVAYKYTDTALVPKTMSRRSSLGSPVMTPRTEIPHQARLNPGDIEQTSGVWCRCINRRTEGTSGHACTSHRC